MAGRLGFSGWAGNTEGTGSELRELVTGLKSLAILLGPCSTSSEGCKDTYQGLRTLPFSKGLDITQETTDRKLPTLSSTLIYPH